MTVAVAVTHHDADYQAIERVIRLAEPDSHTSAADMAEWDSVQKAAGRESVRLLATAGAEPVAFATAAQPPELAAEVWWGTVKVVPAHRHQGLGRMLVDRLEALAAARGVARLFGTVREDDERSIRFAERAGYLELDREWRSTLRLGDFDPGLWRRVVDGVLASGIRFVSMRELLETDAGSAERIHRLWTTLDGDVPTPLDVGPLPLADFVSLFVTSDQALPDAFLVAVDGDDLVGLTQLLAVRSDDTAIEQELTGVVPSHRGRGIATALKAEAARWAKEHGYASIRTYNAQSNEPMLAVNTKLGFEREVGLIEVDKRLNPA